MTASFYRLAVREPHAHLVEVEARFPDVRRHGAHVDLRMAAWTPGSYLVRDYARHVQDLVVEDGQGKALAVDKTDKATWRVTLGGAHDLVVRWRVYAWELTVRTNHVDDSHAFVNAAPTYLWIGERAAEGAEIVVEAPRGWHVVSGLPRRGDAFVARDLDELLDSPIHAGPAAPIEFVAAGKPTQLAVWGRHEAGAADPQRLVADTTKIIDAYARLFAGAAGPEVPYERYAFMLMLAPGAYGGLEHRASTALLSSPFAFATRKKYEELLELVSHEFFHLWNVKRIRPAALGPFDYARENYTRALWVMEGITSYYDRYTLRRAELMSSKRYLGKLAEEWGKLLAIPGRKKQSIAESSFDAWIKLYRPDENTVNSTVSYYLKGGLVALCLDLEIRRRSGGMKSLDDVMRALWARYGAAARGFEEAAFRFEVEAAVGLELGEFFARFVDGREDPDLAAELAACGLTLRGTWDKPRERDRDGNGAAAGASGAAEAEPPAWLGVNTKSEGGRAVVAATLAGSPAEAAGLYAGDEIVAADGWKVSESSLGDRLAARRPGDTLVLSVFRRDELREVRVVLGAAPRDKWEIVVDKAAAADARARYTAWLGEAWPG